MTDYENGVDTRKKIVSAAQALFYAKGYHETGFQDIYKRSHVSRGTVYYHFKTKEAIRYEVLWEFTMAHKRLVEKYCDREEYHYLLALAVMWIVISQDPQYRKFIQDYCNDCRVYSKQMDLSLYHATIYQVMWGKFWDRDKISEISFAAVYGYLIGFCLMLCEHPGRYDPVELFIHCNNDCLALWGIPADKMDAVWKGFRYYLSLIPRSEMKIQLSEN